MATPLEQVESLVSADFPQHRFLALAVAKLLHEANPEWLQEVLEKVNPPQAEISWKDYNGTPLANFLGLDRSQIKGIFGMKDSDVDEIYKRLNVTEEDKPEAKAEPEQKPEDQKAEGGSEGESAVENKGEVKEEPEGDKMPEGIPPETDKPNEGGSEGVKTKEEVVVVPKVEDAKSTKRVK